VIVGGGAAAEELYAAAQRPYAVNKSVVRVSVAGAADADRLPPSLGQTLPGLPGVAGAAGAVAVVCSGFTCQAPTSDAAELRRLVAEQMGAA
jgi:uncharacterized protein YyaL (SSP411 family)